MASTNDPDTDTTSAQLVREANQTRITPNTVRPAAGSSELQDDQFVTTEGREESDFGARRAGRSSIHETPLPSPSPSSVRAARSRKPALGRRRTSMLPHRGQEFSIDDDPTEYEELSDRALATEYTSAFDPSVRRQSASDPFVRRQSATQRRISAVKPHLLPRIDSENAEDEGEERGDEAHTSTPRPLEGVPEYLAEEDPLQDEDAGLSDTEGFTLKDRQTAINQTHPFGIRIWQPALYRTDHDSINEKAEKDIHSTPGAKVSLRLWGFNTCWTVLFGWWLAAACFLGAGMCFCFAYVDAPGAREYGDVLAGLAGYVIWPFGKFVSLKNDETYSREDEGYGRSPGDYEQWQSGDLEHGRLFFAADSVGHRRTMNSESERASLLGDPQHKMMVKAKRRLFGRGRWNAGRVIFFAFYYLLIGPLLLAASAVCWLTIFAIPMGRVTLILGYHLRQRPLALGFHSTADYTRSDSTYSILLCTYRAVGIKYWRYTIDGTNIIILDLLAVVVFTIVDFWCLGILPPAASFVLALLSIIPLAFFIGQAVASISAQSSMGVGAAINAFFSTIVEVYLYCIALNEGKSRLVEGSLIGSVLAGVLFLPGLSMCFGAVKRKTQRFNVKSAGATSTMLLFAMIAVFSPTLFYQIYGVHQVHCQPCITPDTATDDDCHRCYSTQIPPITDQFFATVVLPYCWFAAVMLFLSYMIGLWFTLRTHASIIWATDEHQSHHPNKSKHPDTGSIHGTRQQHTLIRTHTFLEDVVANVSGGHDQEGAGHDAPNWSKTKSSVILVTATVAYAIIAEVLVKTVDTILQNVDIDEKFLGLTLFALVPNTTEFLNAISFAINGNIALSMEIGSAYTLQVCLIQIPAVVLYSAVHGRFLDPKELVDHTFNLVFAQWDMIAMILCVFLLSYTYGEGKSNYFKGSILILAYLVVMAGFYISGYDIEETVGTTHVFQGRPLT